MGAMLLSNSELLQPGNPRAVFRENVKLKLVDN